MELILTNHSSNQNIFNVKYVENSERYNVGLKTGQIIENQQSIGTMTFDLGWPWNVIVQGYYNYTLNISKTVTDTMTGSMEVE